MFINYWIIIYFFRDFEEGRDVEVLEAMTCTEEPRLFIDDLHSNSLMIVRLFSFQDSQCFDKKKQGFVLEA